MFQVLIEKVHSQYLSGCKSVYMVVVTLDNFNTFKPSTLPMAQFYSHLSDESNQDARTIEIYLIVLLQFLLYGGLISTIIWYHIYGCKNQYNLASYIYILSYIALYFYYSRQICWCNRP